MSLSLYFSRTISKSVAQEKCDTLVKEVCVTVPVPSCSTVTDTLTKQVQYLTSNYVLAMKCLLLPLNLGFIFFYNVVTPN